MTSIVSLQKAKDTCTQLKLAVTSSNPDITKASNALDELKELLLDFDSLPPLSINSSLANEERQLACEIFEYGVLASIHSGDREQFQRYVSSLQPYYIQYKLQSSLKYQIRGLYLLFLLVENRLSDFHSELELMTEEEKQEPAISFCIQLDRHLMMGSYKEVMSEAATPPFSHYTFFLKSLLETVRVNIVDCISASYKSLTLSGATEILMFTSTEETKTFIHDFHPEWKIEGDLIDVAGHAALNSEEIPSMKLIEQTLTYATELERIV